MVPVSAKYIEKLVGKGGRFQSKQYRVYTYDLSSRRARAIMKGRVMEEFKFLNTSCLRAIFQCAYPNGFRDVSAEDAFSKKQHLVSDRRIQLRLRKHLKTASFYGAQRLVRRKKSIEQAKELKRKTREYKRGEQ